MKEQEAAKANTTAEGLAERRKGIAKSIQEFRSVQKVYMPGLSNLIDSDGSKLDTRPELFKLVLPSQLSPDERQSWCLPGLPTLEARFRYAQADGALAEIRRLRQIFQGLSDQNRKHINNSQGTVTCTLGTFGRYKTQISRFAMLYRHARRALIALDPAGKITQWTPRFLELKDADIRGPGREADEPSEGQTVSSWIWLVPKPGHPLDKSIPIDSDLSTRAATGEEVAVSIRAHWARCQARAERYEEEVELTVEEMRRTLEFFKWKSKWWLGLQDLRTNSPAPPDPQVLHGLRAYAHRQSSIYSSLVTTYVDHWREFLVERSLGLEWLSLYTSEPPQPTEPTSAEGIDEALESDEGGDAPESNDDGDEPDFEDTAADPEFEEMFVDLPGN